MINLQTRTSEACTWQVSPDTVTMNIVSGRDKIWLSKQCPDAIPVQDVVVRLASVTQVPVVWNSRRSDEECSDRTAWALPGFYHVRAAALGGEATDVQFELVAPAPPTVTQTATPGRLAATATATATGTATATAGSDHNRLRFAVGLSYLRATRASSWTDPPRGRDRTRMTIAPLCGGAYWLRTT